MPSHPISRREAIARTGLLLGTAAAPLVAAAQPASASSARSASSTFRYCLNTATIRGQKLGIVKEVEIAAQAGYQAIEPWVDSIQEYAKGGGSLPDLKKRIADLGLTLEDAISFPEWAVDDDSKRARGVELAKTYMDLLTQVGGKRIACPPRRCHKPTQARPVQSCRTIQGLAPSRRSDWGRSPTRALGILPEPEPAE